jgi:hypothetical protein
VPPAAAKFTATLEVGRANFPKNRRVLATMFQWKFNAKLATVASMLPLFWSVELRGPWRSPFGRSAVGSRVAQRHLVGELGATRARRGLDSLAQHYYVYDISNL